MRGTQSKETRGDKGETQVDDSIQLRDAGTRSSETSGEIGCLNDAPKTLREEESSSRTQEETLIADTVRRMMFEGSGGRRGA